MPCRVYRDVPEDDVLQLLIPAYDDGAFSEVRTEPEIEVLECDVGCLECDGGGYRRDGIPLGTDDEVIVPYDESFRRGVLCEGRFGEVARPVV